MSLFNSASEETPLLQEELAVKEHERIYERFSAARKRTILGMTSMCGFMPLFISGTFIPCIPQVAHDLNSDGATISLAVSISVLASSLGALFGSAYSGFYGRRPIYLAFLPLSLVGSIGAAQSHSVAWLLFWRFWQSAGISPVFSVGAGVIGDCFKLEERGTAMGVFLAAVLIGPAVAPMAGGFAAYYSSWRAMQWCIGIITTLMFVVILLFFPETSHPGSRGIDKLRAEGKLHPTARPVLLNPFAAMGLLRSPTLMLVSMAGLMTLVTEYVLLVPIAYTIGERYGIKNEFLIGLCFMPDGIGSMIGAPLSGRLSDKIVARMKAKQGEWYPEDRLRAALLGAAAFVPLSALASGLATRYLEGTLGLVVNLVCLFFNGLGVDMTLSPMSAYLVDILHSRSAESMAANSAFRSIFLALSIAGVVPAIERYGVLITNIGSALLGWTSFGILWVLIQYGTSLRACVDVGFSTEANN